MKSSNYIRFVSSCFAFAMCVWLNPAAVHSQTEKASSRGSAAASLRGTAKLKGDYAVDGVIVVVTPRRPRGEGSNTLSPMGRPVPARVVKGEYRIDGLVPGEYDLKAVGLHIKDKTLTGIVINAGGVNVVNLGLLRVDKPRRVSARIRDSQGALRGVSVAIYSAELPAAICAACMLAEVRSNKRGEIRYPALGRGQSYSLAIRRNADGQQGKDLIATNVITIGATHAEIQLRLGTGPNPEMTAVLKDDDAPLRIRRTDFGKEAGKGRP